MLIVHCFLPQGSTGVNLGIRALRECDVPAACLWACVDAAFPINGHAQLCTANLHRIVSPKHVKGVWAEFSHDGHTPCVNGAEVGFLKEAHLFTWQAMSSMPITESCGASEMAGTKQLTHSSALPTSSLEVVKSRIFSILVDSGLTYQVCLCSFLQGF